MATASNDPQQQTREFTIANARVGGTDSWADDPMSSVRGISSIIGVRVYTLVNNVKTLVRTVDGATLTTGTSTIGAYSDVNVQLDHRTTAYNAFGEATSRSLNGLEYEYSSYDKSGQVWKTNAGDGVDKAFSRNVAGQVTAEIKSTNTAAASLNNLKNIASPEALQARLALYSVKAQSDFVRTEIRYDLMGRAIEQVGSGQQVGSAMAPTTANKGMLHIGYRILEKAVIFGSGVTGTNTVELEFQPIAGLEHVEYSAVLTYAGMPPAQEPGVDDPVDPGPYEAGVTFSSDSVAGINKVTFNFGENRCDTLLSVKYYVREVDGQWKMVGTSAAPVKYLSVATAPDALAESVLEYTYVKNGSPVTGVLWSHVRRNDATLFNVTQLEAGYNYTFRSFFTDPALNSSGEPLVRTIYNTGSFTVNADGSISNCTSAATPDLVRPTSYQRMDRWGNVIAVTDPRNPNWSTTYSYNSNNQVIERRVGNEVVTTYYDMLGRQVGTKDGRGNVTSLVYDVYGNLYQTLNPDGGYVTNGYNLFGERTSMVQSEGTTTLYSYDKLSRLLTTTTGLVEVWSASNSHFGGAMTVAQVGAARGLVEKFTYDAMGNRTSFTNGADEKSIYTYDFDGNIVKAQDAQGNITLSKYDAFRHKIANIDANGGVMTWQVDAYGTTTSHVDLAGVTTSYAYDGLRHLVSQRGGKHGSGLFQHQEYSYAGNLLVRIDDSGVGSVTSYAYDKAGNRQRETTRAAAGTAKEVVAQDNAIQYDRQGRMKRVADGVFDVRITYDANGNRTEVETIRSTRDISVVSTSTNNTFDAMNRVKISNGIREYLNPSNIVIGINGHEMTYDLAGRRKTDTFSYDNKNLMRRVETENYAYDDAGRISTVTRSNSVIDIRKYDGAGRIVKTGPSSSVSAYTLDGFRIAAEVREYAYDSAGNMIRLQTRDLANVVKSNAYYMPTDTATVAGYDRVGNVIGYSVRSVGGAELQYQHKYLKYDTYKEQTVLGSFATVGGYTGTDYDANGNAYRMTDAGDILKPKESTFVSDIAGRVLLKNTSTGLTRSLIVNGEVFGQADQNDIASGFGDVYQPALSPANAAAPSVYQVQSTGQTLTSIAQSVWGDQKLWYLIADANSLSGNVAPAVGTVLRLPARVNTVHNDYSTFKPYNPLDAIGSTTPDLPAPHGPEACGAAGTIFVLVVAVIVTLATAAVAGPWVAGMLSNGFAATVITGAMAGAAGATAAQLASIFVGQQEDFSWSAVGRGALAGAISGAVKAVGFSEIAGSTFLADAANAMISAAMTQAVFSATKMQEGFSWRKVGAIGIATYLGKSMGGAVGGTVGKAFGNSSQLINETVSATLTGFASNAVATAVTGGKFNMRTIATDAFGNALGEALGRPIAQQLAMEARKREQEKRKYSIGRSVSPFNRNAGNLSEGFRISGRANQPVSVETSISSGESRAASFGQNYGDQPPPGVSDGDWEGGGNPLDTMHSNLLRFKPAKKNREWSANGAGGLNADTTASGINVPPTETLVTVGTYDPSSLRPDIGGDGKYPGFAEKYPGGFAAIVNDSKVGARACWKIEGTCITPPVTVASVVDDTFGSSSAALMKFASQESGYGSLLDPLECRVDPDWVQKNAIANARREIENGSIAYDPAKFTPDYRSDLQRVAENPMFSSPIGTSVYSIAYLLGANDGVSGVAFGAGASVDAIGLVFVGRGQGIGVQRPMIYRPKLMEYKVPRAPSIGYNQGGGVPRIGYAPTASLSPPASPPAIVTYRGTDWSAARTNRAASSGRKLLTNGANTSTANTSTAIPSNPTAYSVAFETRLTPADFGRSRDVHFNRSNAALDDALKDADYAKLMDDLIPGVQSSVSSVGGRATPSGWTWEHASSTTASGQQGVMRLVPSSQHTPGSPFWRVLHPDRGAAGGYSEWAIPNGAPKN